MRLARGFPICRKVERQGVDGPPGPGLWTSFALALSLLTVIPLGVTERPGDRQWRRAVWMFPSVGALIGVFLAGLDSLGRMPGAGWKGFSAALVLAGYFLVTGGLHHDGLADAADAFLGARDREGRLRIMRDTSVGAFGAGTLFLYFLLSWNLLTLLPEGPGREGFRFASLVCLPTAGRATMAWLCCRCGYARKEGTGNAVVSNAGSRDLGWVAAAFLVISVLSLGLLGSSYAAGLAVVLVSLALAELAALYTRKAVGGITGDLLGASGLVVEVFVLWLLASWPVGRIP